MNGITTIQITKDFHKEIIHLKIHPRETHEDVLKRACKFFVEKGGSKQS